MTQTSTQRKALLERLRNTDQVAVLIVGGGINGVGTFRDLSLQGVDCLLVERNDFCSGTSRAPSRMIHGGLKYLETGEFRLVRESAEERNRLLANAAHYVRPLEMIIPIHGWWGGMLSAIRRFLRLPAKMQQRGALIVKLGLALYDFYGALNRALPRHRMIRRQDILREIPDLDPGIRIAASYYDAWILSPERLVVELALDGMAANPGSMALNHLRCEGIEGNHVRLVDELSGEEFRIGCKVMVNAAGPWIDSVNHSLGHHQPMISGTKGSHLLLDLPAFARTLHQRMMYFEAEGGRICLVSNFMGHVLLGSTDIPVDDPDDVVCDDQEVAYLFEAFRRIFPEVPVSREDIFFSYAGVRPLPATDAEDPGAISRDHSMPELEPSGERDFPILSLVGGKWTTFRAFAAEATDEILQRLGSHRRISTEALPIGGGHGLSQQAATVEGLLNELVQDHGLTRTRAQQLVTRYGTRACPLVASLEGPEHLLTTLPHVSREELAFIADHELAHSASDLLFGRSSLALEGPLGYDALAELVAVLAKPLQWSEQRQAAELQGIIEYYRRFHRIEVKAIPGAQPHFV